MSFSILLILVCCVFFFFNDTATTEIYTLSLHDALPIYRMQTRITGDDLPGAACRRVAVEDALDIGAQAVKHLGDRKSTRLNSSHTVISYAVFCLEKKKKKGQLLTQV